MAKQNTKNGGIYAASPVTLTDGGSSSLYVDVNGNLLVSQATLQAGEDLANDVQKVEQRFTPLNITTLATTVVKTGVGLLHTITINTSAANGTITIYDNTAASGTVIGTITQPAALLSSGPVTITLNATFSIGLTIVTGVAAENLTVSYR